MTEVFIDMDGVLCNWRKGFREKTGFSIEDYAKKNKDHYYLDSDFYANLEPMAGAIDLLSYLTSYFRVQILTSTGARDNEFLHKSVSDGKIRWFEKNFPYIKQEDIIFVNAWNKKPDYLINQFSILIDDKKETVNIWNQKGGIGILHVNSYLTMSQVSSLEEFLGKEEE